MHRPLNVTLQISYPKQADICRATVVHENDIKTELKKFVSCNLEVQSVVFFVEN